MKRRMIKQLLLKYHTFFYIGIEVVLNMEIVNIVIIVDLQIPLLDLDMIHSNIKSTEFTSKASRWLKMRLYPENFYVAFYRSGKFSMAGIKKIEDIQSAVDRILIILRDFGISIENAKISINTMTCVDKIELKRPLSLIFQKLNHYKTSYEPEQFHGLIYKDWGAAFILFNSGKFIVTGLKSKEMADKSIKKFKDLIKYD